MRPRRLLPAPTAGAAIVASALVAACGGSGTDPSTGASPVPRASEAEWQALSVPRPEPLAGAPLISLGAVEIVGSAPWSGTPGVDAALGLSELVAAGLLRRADVHFVERRRFAAAAEAERRGLPRGENAPPVGTSPGSRFIASAVWASVGLDSAYVDLRLADAQSGALVASWRGATAAQSDPVSVARTVVSGILAALDKAGGRPAWQDPVAGASPAAYGAAGVNAEAVLTFFRALAAEDAWRWEEARSGYQRALAAGGPSFLEAAAALARTARLRNGGTLGAS